MTTLTITAQGEVTLSEEILRHLGVPHGGVLDVELLPNGHVNLTAPKGTTWRDLSGMLKEKSNGTRFTIEELNDAIGDAGCAAGMNGLPPKSAAKTDKAC